MLAGIAFVVLSGMFTALNLSSNLRKRKVLTAEHFILKSANGQVIGRLGAGTDSQPTLTFYDQQKHVRALVSLKDEGAPWLAMVDAAGKLRVSFSMDKMPMITLSDPVGTLRWSASVDDTGAHFRAFDAKGKEVSAR